MLPTVRLKAYPKIRQQVLMPEINPTTGDLSWLPSIWSSVQKQDWSASCPFVVVQALRHRICSPSRLEYVAFTCMPTLQWRVSVCDAHIGPCTQWYFQLWFPSGMFLLGTSVH